MTNFKKTIFSVVGMLVAITSWGNIASSYAAEQIDGGYLERSQKYSQDFNAHFGGCIYGLNQILKARDHRKAEWFYSEISSEQIKCLKTFLKTTQKYAQGCNDVNIPNNEAFWDQYNQVTGRQLIAESGHSMHHIIPRDLNGPNEPWNFVQLRADEHKKISNFITLVGALNGRTLSKDKVWIENRLGKSGYDKKAVADYLNWLKLSH